MYYFHECAKEQYTYVCRGTETISSENLISAQCNLDQSPATGVVNTASIEAKGVALGKCKVSLFLHHQ
jgi:hypothetical protein